MSQHTKWILSSHVSFDVTRIPLTMCESLGVRKLILSVVLVLNEGNLTNIH